MSGWKSFITHSKKLDQDELKKKALEEMRQRDENLKQNWQNYHDEHKEED